MSNSGDQRPKKKSLFSDSTMTLGEHLEELRACLFKAVFGLMIGFLVGLFLGPYMVNLIKSPLQDALKDYYEDQALDWAVEQARKDKPGTPTEEAVLRKENYPDVPLTLEQLKYRIKYQHLIPKAVYFEPEEEPTLVQPPAEMLVVPAPDENSPDPTGAPYTASPTPSQTTAPDSDKTSALAPKSPEEIRASLPKLVRKVQWIRIDDDARIQIRSLNAHEAFMIYIKASLLVGALLASPWIFYQIWSFVAAGLYPHERRYIHVFLPFSLGLFLLGACGAFIFVFPPVLKFLFMFNDWMGIDPDPRISEWLGFVMILPIGFGISFQLPLVMLFLQRIGIFTIDMYLSRWRVAILVIAVASMMLTPADPYSMLLMAVPLTILYFGGVLLCQMMPKISRPYDQYEDEEVDEF